MGAVTSCLRNIASAVKTFKPKKTDSGLDLSYIPNDPPGRIIAMCAPATGLKGAVLRNPVQAVAAYLNETHVNYRIYNLLENNDTYPSDLFNGKVIHYATPDHQVPTFHALLTFCENATTFMNMSPENVIAVHCKAGKGRTGLFICCLLLYQGTVSTVEQSFALFATNRSQLTKMKYVHVGHRSSGSSNDTVPSIPDSQSSSSSSSASVSSPSQSQSQSQMTSYESRPKHDSKYDTASPDDAAYRGVENPSQVRWVHYFRELIHKGGFSYLRPCPKLIRYVHVHAFTLLDSLLPYERNVISFMCVRTWHPHDEGQVIMDTRYKSVSEVYKGVYRYELNTLISEETKIELWYGTVSSSCIAHAWIHPLFIKQNYLCLNKSMIDGAYTNKSIDSNFKMEFFFEDSVPNEVRSVENKPTAHPALLRNLTEPQYPTASTTSEPISSIPSLTRRDTPSYVTETYQNSTTDANPRIEPTVKRARNQDPSDYTLLD